MKKILAVAALAAPALAFAQSIKADYFVSIITAVQNILNLIVPIVIGVVVVLFLWEGYKYFKAEGDDKAAIRNKMLEGVIIIAVMVSLWGLVALVKNIAGVTDQGATQGITNQLLPR